MIQSLASGLTSRKETSAVAVRLFSSSLLLSQTQKSNGCEAFVDHAFSLLSSNDRSTGYRLLGMIIEGGIKDGRFGNLFDRLPSLVASIGSGAEGEALLSLLQTILDVGTEDMMGHLNRVLSKIVGSCVRLMGREDESTLSGIRILREFAQSRLRSLLLPSNANIKQACIDLLPYTEFYFDASSLLATITASESPGVWTNLWLQLSRECVDLLQNFLGLHVSVNKGLAVSCPSSVISVLKPLVGARRAVAVEQLLRGRCQALAAMLSTGCASGPAQVDLSAFLPALLAALPWVQYLSVLDAKATLSNAQGISPADMALVAPAIKLHLLSVAEALMRGQPSGLGRQAATICRPLLALLAGPESRAVAAAMASAHQYQGFASATRQGALHELYLCSLRCVALACQCFPSIVARSGSAGLQAMVDSLTVEMAAMSTYRGPLGQATGTEDAGDGRSSNCIPRWVALMGAVEALLLFCAPMLPAPLAASIETSVGVGLACMCKGILLRHGSEKKSRRAAAEALRSTPSLQLALLRLAHVEALAAPRGGVLSGNLSLLRAACIAAFHQPETSGAAALCSLALDALLQPAGVALPAIPPAVSASEYLAFRSKAAATAAAAGEGAGAGENRDSYSSASTAVRVDGQESSRGRIGNEKRKSEVANPHSGTEAEADYAKDSGAGIATKRQKHPDAQVKQPSQLLSVKAVHVDLLGAAGEAKKGLGVGTVASEEGDEDDELPELDLHTAV